MKYCDLHTHSHFSDGMWSPTQIIEEAERIGLSAVALTDHNNINGLDEFVNAAKGKKVEAIRGIEISTDYGEKELHIVGLYLPRERFEDIKKLLAEMLKRKAEANVKLAENLCKDGYAVDIEKITAEANGFVNRANIASALLEGGYVASVKEAFDTLLSKNGSYYVQNKRLDALEAVAFLKSIGAAAVLAHPFLELNEAELRKFITEAKKYGLDAIETHYSTFTSEETALAERIADELGIKQSGGSDFHAAAKPDIEMGTGKGNITIPIEIYENLVRN